MGAEGRGSGGKGGLFADLSIPKQALRLKIEAQCQCLGSSVLAFCPPFELILFLSITKYENSVLCTVEGGGGRGGGVVY